jgi:NAD(P)-dependent dehydrogenase (short-subunit alcohol dehydrogenase family)
LAAILGPAVEAWRAGDFAILEDVERLAAAVFERCARLDALVHAAGAFARGPAAQTGGEHLERLWHVNATAPFRLTLSLRPLLAVGPGDVVFINSSIVRDAGVEELSAYAASKHALKALTDSLRAELNPEGIRVLSVHPGRTATPMQAQVMSLERREYVADRLLQPASIAALIAAAIALPRSAEVTDIHVRPTQKP